MSVVRIPKPERRPESGGGMDRAVERRGLPAWAKAGLAGAGALLVVLLFYFLAPGANSQTVDASRLTISTVSPGRFDDFLPLRARVEPLVTVYLDAVEGGRVERVLVEDGAMVQAGQLLAVLSNSDLQLNVLARQTEVTQQINSMRSQELALSQTRLANERAVIEAELAVATARRQYELQRPLAERGFVSQRQFADSRDAYEAARQRLAVLRRTRATDEQLQSYEQNGFLMVEDLISEKEVQEVFAEVQRLAADPYAQAELAWALGYSGRVIAVEACLAKLDAEDEQVRRCAADTVATIVGLSRDDDELWEPPAASVSSPPPSPSSSRRATA